MSDRRIVLGMPGYGKQTADAGRGFWRACADMSVVYNIYQNGSLLACNFNQLWCAALNLVNQGQRVDYFAMMHDDIGPEDFWLDKLIDELESQQLDVLGVAVPIKDTRGITSMALQGEDDWLPHARLTMRDIYELPETFTGDDLGRPLLLNTGCWVCKFDIEWARMVHFTINDRIVFNTAANRYQAQTEPEDWYFSRLLHEVGTGPTAHLRPLKIGATRKIAIHHRGEMDFTNQRPWGSQFFDSESCQISPVPGAFPYDVLGWLLPEEGKALAKLAEGKRVLEIGSYCGLSTICLARTAEHVTAVDYFDGRGTPEPRDTRAECEANLERYGVRDKVLLATPLDPCLEGGSFDLVFIDGDHAYDSVRSDISAAMECLAPGGIIAFHDYDPEHHPGVVEAVNELLADGGQLISQHETLAVVRPPAAIPLEV